MVTKEQLRTKLLESIKSKEGENRIQAGISEYLEFIKDNYKDLDDDAKTLADHAFDVIHESAKEAVENMPDGIEKRKLARLHARASGGHWDIEQITKSLESRTHLEQEVLKETETFFLKYGQMFADFMHDVMTNSLNGSDLAILGLYCSVIDELIVAYHLAQHGYGPQTFSHVRVVYETKDLIELFHTKPDYIDLWSSNDEASRENIRRELSPAGIREKIGRERYDPVFSFLSELGSHATFKYIQSKIGMTAPGSLDDEKLKATIWVGGSPRLDQLIFANTALVQALMMSIVSFTNVYQKYLLAEEGIEVLEKSFEEYREYMLKYFCDWMDENGTDASKAREFLKSIKI